MPRYGPKTGFHNELDTASTSMAASIPRPTESLQWMTRSGTRNETVPRVEEGARGSRARADDDRSGFRSDAEAGARHRCHHGATREDGRAKAGESGSLPAGRPLPHAPTSTTPAAGPRRAHDGAGIRLRRRPDSGGRSQPRARCNKVPGKEAEQAPRQRVERQAALPGLRLEQQPMTTNAGVRNEDCHESDPQADAVIATTKRRLWRRLR